MRLSPVILGHGLGIVLGIAVTASAHGQPATPAKEAQPKAPAAKGAAVEDTTTPATVHKLEVYQGPNRIVHYVPSGNLSTSDRLAAYEMERAENDLAYAHNLQRLKQQYVNSERVLEPQRRYVQEQLYGTSISYGSSFGGYGGLGGYGGFGYGGRGYFPYVFGSYGNASLGNMGGYFGSNNLSVTRNLQFGMGDEGRLKEALVQAILADASPEYAAQALRNYDTAVARAASSPTLARALNLQKGTTTYAAYEPTFTKGGNVVIWVGNEKYSGTVKDDHPGWVVLQTANGEVSVRKSEITRSETPAKPAANPGK